MTPDAQQPEQELVEAISTIIAACGYCENYSCDDAARKILKVVRAHPHTPAPEHKETEEEYQIHIDEEETWDRLTGGGYGSDQ